MRIRLGPLSVKREGSLRIIVDEVTLGELDPTSDPSLDGASASSPIVLASRNRWGALTVGAMRRISRLRVVVEEMRLVRLIVLLSRLACEGGGGGSKGNLLAGLVGVEDLA